jgi:hypothetical protein
MFMTRALLSICFAAELQAANFSLPITVTKLPSDSEFIVIRTPIDFSEILRALNVITPVDERSLRLFELRGSRKRVEIPYQFTAASQPRPRSRPLLPGTSSNVSYAAEYSATNAPADLKVTGEICWIVAKPKSDRASFVLEFAAPAAGRIVQTPFPPENFRVFDPEGRATPAPWFPSMQLHPQWPADGVVHFYEDQKLITSYHLGASLNSQINQRRRPFFYPVNGPDGIGLTEFGKPHDPTGSHAHHYSIWIAHNNVDGIDFWGERGGVIAHESLAEMEDGAVFSRLIQKARWRHESRDLLRETRTITVYKSADDFRALDIELALEPAASNKVTFGKTSFGFLAARVAQSMTVFDGAGEIRTSAGKLNESGAHLTHGKWLDQSGPITQDKWGGIAILDSPDNPNFPTGWHCRNDGWAGAAFNMDAPHVLESGITLRLRYRVILHRGDAAKAKIERRFEEWTARPELQFGSIKKL